MTEGNRNSDQNAQSTPAPNGDAGSGEGRSKSRAHLFQPGNPGKRPGTRNKATLAAEALFDKAAEKLTALCIEKAQAGDSLAMRLALERIIPPRRERPLRFRMPPLRVADDAACVMAAIAEAVAEGELTPGEAESMSKLVDAFARAIEIGEFGQRLKALEDRQA